MLFSKANLTVALVASKDPFDRALNGVQFEKDGSTVAGNKKVLVACGPTREDLVHWPDSAGAQVSPPEKGMVLPLEVVEEVKKNIPRDKRISLQHVALTRVEDDSRVGLTSVNARGDSTTKSTMPKPFPYPDWKVVVRRVRGEGDLVRMCLNRKDLIHMLRTLETAAPDKSGTNPVFIEVGKDGRGLVARCLNHETGQHVIGAISLYKLPVGQWMKRDRWEQEVFGERKKVRKLT